MYENHDLVKNGLKMVKMANRSLHQSSFRLDMRYRKFGAFLETSSFFPVVWRGITQGGQTFLHWEGGGQTFYVKDVGGDDDVDGEEEDVSEANILVSEASKLSAGARIFRGP